MFEAERQSLRRPFDVCQSKQSSGMYLQMIPPFAIDDEFISECDKFLGLTFLMVVASEAESGHFSMSVFSNVLSGASRFRLETKSRANIAARAPLCGLLHGL